MSENNETNEIHNHTECLEKEAEESSESVIEEQESKDPLIEMKELVQRTQANFENFRKQQEKRMEEFKQFVTRDVISKLIPVLDNFELALKNTENQKEFVDGVMLIHEQMGTMLTETNVKIIDALGDTFDPTKHEALMKIASDKPEDTIIEVFSKGYTLSDIVIRPARVKVSSGVKK